MSEYINNREYRQKAMKEMIMELHSGKSVEEVKPRFAKIIEGISAREVGELEKSLVMEGMPIEEIQRLCDVHAAVFGSSIEEIHRDKKPEETPGHPVHTFRLENRKIEALIKEDLKPQIEAFKADDSEKNLSKLDSLFGQLMSIDKHYLRKENLLFPYMEKYGITAPPKVMWGVDDEIRELLKKAYSLIKDYHGDKEQLLNTAAQAITKVEEMIFKEENILFPMVLETLTEDEWKKIADESGEIGYTLIESVAEWKPANKDIAKEEEKRSEVPSNNGYIRFDTGILTPAEISGIFSTLPMDITFVDKEGAVKYFSQGKERIFPRTKAIIGRQVQNCHPPASVHIVEKIVEDLKAGRKDHEDFWIRMGNKFVFIRYFAVRNEKNEFMGVLEVTQDIGPIQEITGEKRLVSE